jgi:predicted RND superfamily exporter protein
MAAAFSRIYAITVLDQARATLAVLAVISALFAWGIRDFKLDASADTLILESDADLQRFREMSEHYATREFLFVTFAPEGDLFSDESLSAIARLRDDLRALPGVESVTSLVDIPLVKQKEGTLLQLAQNYRTLLQDDVDRARAKKELLESPLFAELVISRDGTLSAMQVNLKQDENFSRLNLERNRLLVRKHRDQLTPAEALQLDRLEADYEAAKDRNNVWNHQAIADIRAVMDRYRGEGDLHLGGIPMIADDMITFVRNDLIVFGAGIFLFLVVMLGLIFRGLRWVVIPLLNCIFAGVIMVGLLGLVGWRVTVISSNFISLMLIITMSMNVHLAVRYRQLRRDNPGWDQRRCVLETVERMFWPCLFTSLTTQMGFGSLVVSNIKPVIDFGWMMTLGLAVTLLTSFLLFPAMLMLLRFREADTREKEEVPLTAALARLTERHGGKVLLVSAVLGVLSVAGMSMLKVENSFVNYFRDGTEIHQGLRLIDQKLGGTTPLDIILRFDSDPAPDAAADGEDAEFEAIFGETDKADYWFTPEKVDLIKAVHDHLDAMPEVGKVLSLASTVRLAESLTRGGEEFNTFELAILYKRMPAELKDTMIVPYVSLDRDEAHLTLRVLDSLPDLRRQELLARIKSELQGLAPDQFEVNGLLVLYNNMLQSLFVSQILSLALVMLGIYVMLIMLFRSWSLATIGIIPNILASLIVLGLMGWTGVPLDMMTITIASITIGIAVDNAIHYIYRFREELPHLRGYVRTMHYCHANIGRAVFYTCLTIIVGFSILVLSNFIPTIYFGVLTALAMLVALLLALTLLPQLILMWRPFPVPADPESAGRSGA